MLHNIHDGTTEERLQSLEIFVQNISSAFTQTDFKLSEDNSERPVFTFQSENIVTGTEYIVSLVSEIKRVLITPLKSRVMLKDYGSNLYLLRDREFNSEWRLMATVYIADAIRRHVKRVLVQRVLFEERNGLVTLKLKLKER